MSYRIASPIIARDYILRNGCTQFTLAYCHFMFMPSKRTLFFLAFQVDIRGLGFIGWGQMKRSGEFLLRCFRQRNILLIGHKLYFDHQPRMRLLVNVGVEGRTSPKLEQLAGKTAPTAKWGGGITYF